MPHDESAFDAESFSGVARLFPLPNLVVFPHIMQPLHIFEPRYRQMLEEALAGDGLIAMALLEPGWEKDYDGRPPIRPIACLCRVATHHQTEKGSYNVLLMGLRRVKIRRELSPSKLFREADVELVEDIYPTETALKRADLQRRLVESFRKALPKLAGAQQQLEQLLCSQISLGMLTDIVAYTLNLNLKIKEELLAQPVADLRALLLLECLSARRQAEAESSFPPAFSPN